MPRHAAEEPNHQDPLHLICQIGHMQFQFLARGASDARLTAARVAVSRRNPGRRGLQHSRATAWRRQCEKMVSVEIYCFPAPEVSEYLDPRARSSRFVASPYARLRDPCKGANANPADQLVKLRKSDPVWCTDVPSQVKLSDSL